MNSRRILLFGLAGSLASIAGHPFRALAWQDTPPPMVLQAANGDTQEGGIGTSCWDGQCVDMQSTPYPDCPLLVSEGDVLTLDYAALGPADLLSYAVWNDTGQERPGEPAWSGEIAVEPGPDPATTPRSAVPIPVALPPGPYVMEIFARITGGGDTLQGFRVLVRPAGDAPSPEASATTAPATLSGAPCVEAGE